MATSAFHYHVHFDASRRPVTTSTAYAYCIARYRPTQLRWWEPGSRYLSVVDSGHDNTERVLLPFISAAERCGAAQRRHTLLRHSTACRSSKASRRAGYVLKTRRFNVVRRLTAHNIGADIHSQRDAHEERPKCACTNSSGEVTCGLCWPYQA